MRAARAARLFFLIQPIRSLFYGAVVAFAVAIVLAQTPSRHRFNVVGHKMSRSAAKRRELGVKGAGHYDSPPSLPTEAVTSYHHLIHVIGHEMPCDA